MSSPLTNHKGLTLIELAVVGALIGILASAVTPHFVSTMDAYDLIRQRRQALTMARAGIERMVKEIRLIDSTADINIVQAQNFEFEYPTATVIAYSLSGNQILRNSNVLIDNATALTFTYYDSSGATTNGAGSVRRVRINLTVTLPGTPALTLRTDVFPRNTGQKYANFEVF